MAKTNLTLLIGHRGVGKSSLLFRLKNWQDELDQPADFIDLDQYIEAQNGLSVSEIFKQQGQDIFRSYEKTALSQLAGQAKKTGQKTFIALGAGFQGPYPEDCEIVFVQRACDQKGRIFLDRPRLKKTGSAWQESLDLFQQRESHYSSVCSSQLILQEGKKDNPGSVYQKVFFGLSTSSSGIGGVLTLTPKELAQRGPSWLKDRLDWGLEAIELRSDQWTKKDFERWADVLPREKILWSQRELDQEGPSYGQKDWALELGAPPKNWDIISLHKRKSSLSDTFSFIESHGESSQYLKLALPIHNFTELKAGHDWYLKSPERRSFLPMSCDGRWSWYRLWHKNKMKLNFFKESRQGSASDQPYFHQWCDFDFVDPKCFAAVIGQPISHSWTPNEQEGFFRSRNQPVLGIDMSEEECTIESFEFLSQLGLSAAAVTSPLKNKVAKIFNMSEKESVNTIAYDKSSGEWSTKNTDFYGLQTLLQSYEEEASIVLWGGGGVVPSVCKVLPRLVPYSARTGLARQGFSSVSSPRVVVWAVGRWRQSGNQNSGNTARGPQATDQLEWPSETWRPEVVVDLNYGEDSPGREYALKTGAQYVSGEKMFYSQAEEQRNFWLQFL